MNYALTIRKGIITGRHESEAPFMPNHFAQNPELTSDEFVPIPVAGDYRAGEHILCYNKDGTRQPNLWCIQSGYMALPPDKEIINGELVDMKAPLEEAPEIVKTIILGLQAKVTELENKFTAQAEILGRIALKVEPIEPIKEVIK